MVPGTRILVADDDPELLSALAQALRRAGAHVVCADGSEELIRRLTSEGRFALVVSDVSMPWMNGLHAMRAARNAGLAAPIIIISARTDANIAAEVRALGANVIWLRKPFDLLELEAAAEELLARGVPAPVDHDHG